MLAAHVRALATWPVDQIWNQLVGLPCESSAPLALTPHERKVPLLLKDPSALLVQLILLLPLHMDLSMYNIVVLMHFFQECIFKIFLTCFSVLHKCC